MISLLIKKAIITNNKTNKLKIKITNINKLSNYKNKDDSKCSFLHPFNIFLLIQIKFTK